MNPKNEAPPAATEGGSENQTNHGNSTPVASGVQAGSLGQSPTPAQSGADVNRAGPKALESGNSQPTRSNAQTKPKRPAPFTAPINSARPPQLAKPSRVVTYEEWKDTLQRHYPAFWNYVALCGSVACQLYIQNITQPCGVIFVGAPSCGKSTIFNFFSGDLDTLFHYTDKLTGPSFVTHASTVKREDLEKLDLLPYMRFKTTVIRDLAPIFSAPPDVMCTTTGQLIVIMDGHGLVTNSGTHGRRGYGGKASDDWTLMLLGGTTPPPLRVYDELLRIGPRLFFCNVRVKPPTPEELAARLRRDSTAIETECREMTKLFMQSVWTLHEGKGAVVPMDKIDPKVLDWISKIAFLVAAGRSGEMPDDSEIRLREDPTRAAITLRNLAIGHSMMERQTRGLLKMADLAPLIEVGIETARPPANHVLRSAVRSGTGEADADAVAAEMGCSESTAHRAMEAAAKIGVGVVREDSTRPGKPRKVFTVLGTQFEWLVSPEIKQVMWPCPDLSPRP